MKATALDHIVLEVRDIDRSLQFYQGVLGLPAERLEAFRRGEVPFASVRLGGLLIDLFVRAEPGPGPNHFCLEVDVTATEMVAALKAAGIAHTEPGRRFGARGDGTSVYVHDPDGHQVEIRTYR
ncbi:MAG: VOC family protein [Firmicutes bacterium]|nr:VOC family protein [Bacillota bacterium]